MRIAIALFCMSLLINPVSASQTPATGCDWPAWQTFRQDYLSAEGRVIDPTEGKNITTSEGQSYGLFFALVANEPERFKQILDWTENNLAGGDLTARLPGWLWGKQPSGHWGILDSNSAADSDLWIAYTLLEAGRLWQNRRYQSLGALMLTRIMKEEVVDIPGLGKMLLPGKIGFVDENSWRLNASYQPPQLLARVSAQSESWKAVEKNSYKLLIDAAPKGVAADWNLWQQDKGWIGDKKTAAVGGYDAIRVYLWIGMMDEKMPEKAALLAHYQPMAELTKQNQLPPEKIDTLTGQATGSGPVGFSAALLPFLTDSETLAHQRDRVDAATLGKDAYYNSVLVLFGQGWDRQYYRFNPQGELQTAWDTVCIKNH